MPSPRYTNCPTCGGLAEYLSENFKEAKVLVSARNDALANQLKEVCIVNHMLEQVLDKKLNELSSEDLFDLYLHKLSNEAVENQIKINTRYYEIERRTNEHYYRYLHRMLNPPIV